MVLRPDEATQQPCCSEKMRVVLGDGVSEVDADVGVECTRLTDGGQLNAICDWANQKDTLLGDRVYPARRHDGGGASRSGGARRTAGHEHAGRRCQRASTRWRWADPPDNSDTPDLAASMTAQGGGVWPALAATTVAWDGARSICFHA
jgi:hypothetical protein